LINLTCIFDSLFWKWSKLFGTCCHVFLLWTVCNTESEGKTLVETLHHYISTCEFIASLSCRPSEVGRAVIFFNFVQKVELCWLVLIN